MYTYIIHTHIHIYIHAYIFNLQVIIETAKSHWPGVKVTEKRELHAVAFNCYGASLSVNCFGTICSWRTVTMTGTSATEIHMGMSVPNMLRFSCSNCI